MPNKSTRVPTIGTRVDVPIDLWDEMDRVSREDLISKAQMFREGLALWLKQHKETKSK